MQTEVRTVFDWESLLRRHRVDYATSGRNVGHGEINVRCPRCGGADPSHHMGISLSGRGWSCLRCKLSGRSRAYLIRLLLRCSEDEARALAGYGDAPPAPGEDDLARVIGALRGDVTEMTVRPPGRLTMPPEFHPLADGGPRTEPFLRYLRSRGYDGPDLDWVVREYDLRCATVGPFAWRLIIPVRDRRGALVTWTGRSIRPDAEVRYKTLSTRPDRAAYGRTARIASSSALLGLPALWRAPDPRALVVCEGPMDAIRVSAYGRVVGVYATCLFGLGARDAQLEELELLRGRFPRVWLCIDAGEELRVAGLLARMHSIGARGLRLPAGCKDPGDLSPERAVDLCVAAGG